MRAFGWPAIAAGAVLILIGWVEGAGSASNLHLACNDFPPHKIEHPAADGQPGFDIDIVTEALAGVLSVADLRGRKVATVGGYNLEAELVNAGALVSATSNDKTALDMLVGGNVDVLYAYQLTTEHFIRSDPRSASIVYKEMGRNPYHFCLSRAMPGADAMMQSFNRSLTGMALDGSTARILDAYHVQFR